MALAKQPERSSADLERSLTLYVTETAPSPVEKKSFRRWILLAALALVLHLTALYFSPGWFRPIPPAPIEVQQIDPAKLAAIKRGWKDRGFVLAKDPDRPKEKTPEPKNARYESDRNKSVEKEMRARQTNVIPNVAGDPKSKAKSDRAAKKANRSEEATKIPLSNLSNFKGLPVPGPKNEVEREELRRNGGAGETGDQALMDRTLPEGAENMLNTVESVYYSFYARMSELVAPNWVSILKEKLRRMRPRPGDYLTVVEIILNEDGRLSELRIVQPSGVTEFDDAVAEAWRTAARLPNPPRGLIQSDGKVHIGWSYSISLGDSAGPVFLPPERVF